MSRRTRGGRAGPAADPVGGPAAPADGTSRPGGGGVGPVVAGYRVIRRLGAGSRADVYLGHAGRGDGRDGTNPGQVALKLFHAGTDADSIEREIRALSTVPAGLVGLVDVAVLPDGRACLVLERLTGGLFTGPLREPGGLEPGEAVTILAPVTVALAGLHAAGFGHAGLGPAAILFDVAGRPVLGGLGALVDLPGGGQALAGVLREDCLRLGQLCRVVFGHVDAPAEVCTRADALMDRFESAIQGSSSQQGLLELERALFDWASAKPVRLRRPPREPAVESRPSFPESPVQRGFSAETAIVGDGGPRRRGGLLEGLLDGRPLEGLRERVRERLRARRRPVVVALLVSASALVLALTFLPADAMPGPSTASSRPAATPATSPSASEPATDSGVLAGDDPVPAATALLLRRDECLATASVVCLVEVDQAGSSVLAADSYVVRMAQQQGGAAPPERHAFDAASLVERTGNSALVALAGKGGESQTASVLVVKGEAGWRLREIFDY